MPRWSTARTPSSIADRMASVRPRSRAISAIRSCSWSAERLMIRASSPSSSWRRTRMRAERLPCAYCRAVSMISAQRAGRAATESSTERSAVARRARPRARAAARHRLRALLLDRLDPAGEPGHPDDAPAIVAHRHRGVEQLGSHRGAAPLGARRRPGAGRPAPPAGRRGSPCASSAAPGGHGVGDDPAVGRDHGDPRARPRGRPRPRAGRALRRSCRAASALLDHAGHEAGLRGQGRERVVPRPAVEGGAGQQRGGRPAPPPPPPPPSATMRPRSDKRLLISRPPGPYGSPAI